MCNERIRKIRLRQRDRRRERRRPVWRTRTKRNQGLPAMKTRVSDKQKTSKWGSTDARGIDGNQSCSVASFRCFVQEAHLVVIFVVTFGSTSESISARSV